MPRKSPGRRGETWDIKTQPELLHPILEAKHDEMAKSVKQAYYDIDKIYERVAEILDENGIHTQARLLYRGFAEELYRLASRYSRSTLQKEATAVSLKYSYYGCDEELLKEIAKLFNLNVLTLEDFIITKVVEKPVPTPTGLYYDYDVTTEYSESVLTVGIEYEVEVA